MTQTATHYDQAYQLCPAPIWRRLGAACYDGFIIIMLLLLATQLALLVHSKVFPAGHLGLRLYYLALITSFYAGFWCQRGQTLGMAAWRIRLCLRSGQRLTAIQALWRVIFMGCGLGLCYWPGNPIQPTLLDRLSKTCVYMA